MRPIRFFLNRSKGRPGGNARLGIRNSPVYPDVMKTTLSLPSAGLLLAVLYLLGPYQTQAALWTDYTGDPAGWKESPWFGWFESAGTDPGWYYSYEHGYLWLQGPTEANLWLWDFDMGWLWTSKTYYPYVYSVGDSAWLYYFRQTRFPKWYFHFGYNFWFPVGSGYPASGATVAETASGTSANAMPSLVTLSDGSGVEMPPLGATVPFTVGRESTTTMMPTKGLQTSGPTRTLVIEPGSGVDPEAVRPLVIFPASDSGSLARETMNVLRLESVPDGAGGTVEKRTYLPVSWQADGTFVARDAYMPETVADLQTANGTLSSRFLPLPRESTRAPGNQTRTIRYVPVSFNGSLNYKRSALLVRMVPTDMPPYRKPYSSLSGEEKEKADAVFPHNIVVLVHGHNEEEKEGIYKVSAPAPWLFAYKRDVWTLFYQYLPNYYFTTPMDAESYLSAEHTTRFYEFIYPSYRGIFNYLNIQLARQLEAELAPQLDAGIPVNVVFVAHSMGGIVTRAAIQEFSDPLFNRLMDVMTWGTPHMGSPLVSLRYAMGAEFPYDFAFESDTAALLLKVANPAVAWKVQLALYSAKYLLRWYADGAQLDTPGTRDLRYVRRPIDEPSFRLGLESIFKLSNAQSTLTNRPKYDLQDGTWILNHNLQRLNQSDRLAGSVKFFPVMGRTDRRVEVNLSSEYPYIDIENTQYETAIGATIIPLLVADPEEEVIHPLRSDEVLGTAGQSDGAANIPSMAAVEVTQWVGKAPGWDHEEYYGAPWYNEAGEGPIITEPSKGRNMAKFALERMVGGQSDPAKSYDRYGVMRTPRLGYRLYPGSNTTNDPVTVNDTGYSRVFNILGNLLFHPLDDFYVDPFQYMHLDRIRLVNDPDRSPDKPVSITVTDVITSPDELPSMYHGTSGSFVSTTEFVPGSDRLFTGKIDLGSTDVTDTLLRLQFEFVDGSTLILPPSFIIAPRSTAGTWILDAFAGNNLFGTVIGAHMDDIPVTLDANGSGSFTHEYGESDTDTWDPVAEAGTWYEGTWKIDGTVSLVNNQLEINISVEVNETSKWFDQIEESDDWFEHVKETHSVMEATYRAEFLPDRVVEMDWSFQNPGTEGLWEVESETRREDGHTTQDNASGESIHMGVTLSPPQ